MYVATGTNDDDCFIRVIYSMMYISCQPKLELIIYAYEKHPHSGYLNYAYLNE